MKKYFFSIFILILFSCRSVPDKIVQGEWNYKLFINGIDAGTAKLSNRIEDEKYIYTAEYKMKMANITTITKDTIVETLDYKPVRLESYSKIENDGQVHENNIVSVFNGRDVELTSGNKKFTYTITRDFIIDGNFFMAKLIEGKFRKGLEITNYVYNPSIEVETPIKAITKIVGLKQVSINGIDKKLIHIVQSIENIEDNIDLYIDNKGILQKIIIHMLNLEIEQIII